MSHKKKRGISRSNAAQQTSFQSDPATGKRGIARQDRNKIFGDEQQARKGIARQGRGGQSTAEQKAKGVKSSGMDRNRQDQELDQKPSVKRQDKNAPVQQEVAKTVKRVDKGGQSTAEINRGGVTRMDKNAPVAQEKEKTISRRGVTGQCVEEKKKGGLARTGQMNKSGAALGLEQDNPGKKKAGASGTGAFGQSSKEMMQKTKKTNTMHQSGQGKEQKTKGRRTNKGASHHQPSKRNSTAKEQRTRNQAHMTSSFSFG